MHRLPPAQLRVRAEILFQQKPELLYSDVGQPVVVETDVDRALGKQTRAPFVAQLVEEGGLAGAPQPDYRMYLSGDRRKAGVTPRPGNGRGRLKRDPQLVGENGVQRHECRLTLMCPPVKYTFI